MNTCRILRRTLLIHSLLGGVVLAETAPQKLHALFDGPSRKLWFVQ